MRHTPTSPILASSTAGTGHLHAAAPVAPHAFDPDHIIDWSYRTRCLTCGGERYDTLHRAVRA